jgi:hypothetical protein
VALFCLYLIFAHRALGADIFDVSVTPIKHILIESVKADTAHHFSIRTDRPIMALEAA